MAKYKVIRRCHGFRRRLWEEGQIVDIDPSENPPHHFVMIEDKEVPKVEPIKDVHSLADLQKTPEVKGGMGLGLPKEEPIQFRTRKRKK